MRADSIQDRQIGYFGGSRFLGSAGSGHGLCTALVVGSTSCHILDPHSVAVRILLHIHLGASSRRRGNLLAEFRSDRILPHSSRHNRIILDALV